MQSEIEVAKTTATWLKEAGIAGIVLILGYVIYGLLRKDYLLVPGWLYREKKDECDRLQTTINDLARSNLVMVEKLERKE